MNHNKLLKLTLDVVSTPTRGRLWLKGMSILITGLALSAIQAGEPVEPMRRIGGSAPIQNDPTVPGSKFEGMRRVGGTQPWEREATQKRQEQSKPYYPSRAAYYEDPQPQRQATNNQRMATLDEIRAYGDLARRVPAHLISELSCYMPDYFNEWFVNGRKNPYAPFPSAYCWDRFYADVNAGKKVPLHMRHIDNYNKAQEKFFKDNPGARPDPIPEKDKIDQQAGKTDAGTKADTTDTNTKKGEFK
jgi:hypothetical protein